MSAIELAVAWVLSIFVTLAPPGRPIYYPDAVETKQEAEARLADAAGDLVEIVYNPDSVPVFKGLRGRSRTATLMTAIMLNESGFRKDVDFALGKYGRGDGGRSWCLMQLRVGAERTIRWNYVADRTPRWKDPKEDIFDGYFGQDLVEDRRNCFSEGLKVMRASMTACRKLPLNRTLSGYVSGNCQDGYEGSEDRFRNAANWYHKHAKEMALFNDADVVAQWSEWQKKRHDYVVSSKASTNESRETHMSPLAPITIRKEVAGRKKPIWVTVTPEG